MKSLLSSIAFMIAMLVWSVSGSAAVAVEGNRCCDVVANESEGGTKEAEEEPDCE